MGTASSHAHPCLSTLTLWLPTPSRLLEFSGQRIRHLKLDSGASLVVQWLRLHALSAGDMGSIPGLGTKIPHAETEDPAWHN